MKKLRLFGSPEERFAALEICFIFIHFFASYKVKFHPILIPLALEKAEFVEIVKFDALGFFWFEHRVDSF